jgi:hypothetical protein
MWLKREEIILEWRKLHSEELHNLYSLTDIFRANSSWRIKLTGHVVCMAIQNTSRNLVEKRKGKRPLGSPRSRCEDNIKICQ